MNRKLSLILAAMAFTFLTLPVSHAQEELDVNSEGASISQETTNPGVIRRRQRRQKKAGIINKRQSRNNYIYDNALNEEEKTQVDEYKSERNELDEFYRSQIKAAESSEEKRALRSEWREKRKDLRSNYSEEYETAKTRIKESGQTPLKDYRQAVQSEKETVNQLKEDFKNEASALVNEMRENGTEHSEIVSAVKDLREEYMNKLRDILNNAELTE